MELKVNMNYRKIFKKEKYFWLILCITILACYGFTLTNFSVGVDDEAMYQYFYGTWSLNQGRIGEYFLKYIFDVYSFMPFWHDFLAILLITFSLLLWIYLFEKASDNKFDNKQATIFACTMISFPYIAKSFIFSVSTIGFGVVFILAAITLIFFYNSMFGDTAKGKNYLLAILIASIGLLIGENTAVVILIGFFIIILLNSIYDDKNLKSFSQYGYMFLKLIVMLIVALLFRKILSGLVLNLYSIQKVAYTSNYIAYDFNNIIFSFYKFVKQVLYHFFIQETKDISLIVYRITGIIVILTAIYNSIKKHNFVISLVAIAVILSPLSLCFITGNWNLPGRTLSPMSLFVGFGASLLYLLLKDIYIKQIKLRYISYIFVFYILLYQSKEMNVIFYNDYLTSRLDVEKMDSIMHDLQSESNGILEKPVLFVGIPSSYYIDFSKTELNSIFNWDRMWNTNSELQSGRIYGFFNMFGYSIKGPSIIDESYIRKEISDMSIYPQKGSIKETEEYFIVKIGNTSSENYSIDKESFKEKLGLSLNINTAYCIDYIECKDNIFSISGWGVINGLSSDNYTAEILLSSDINQCMVTTNKTISTDITEHFNDGTNYNSARFYANSIDLNYLDSGVYTVNLILDNGTDKVLMQLDQTIVIK